MSEEIYNAERVVPQSILTSVLINGLLGFGMILSTLFTMTDATAALESPTGYPYMQIFCSSTSSLGGCTVMSAIVPILVTATAVGSLASSSRMAWSFARDRGLPGWRLLSRVIPPCSLSCYTLTQLRSTPKPFLNIPFSL